uniref:Uncharacterized protein n=1 Tax=Sander lucioperca TaxID=283035 RepID=A0A8D0DC18_SANLU
MGKRGDLSSFERGMVVGARRAGLSILQSVRKGRGRGKTCRKMSQVRFKPWTSASRHKPLSICAPLEPLFVVETEGGV